MTCIVAVKNKQSNTVILGADSASPCKHTTYVSLDKKLFKHHAAHNDTTIDIGFLFTSSWRMGQILRHHLEIPRYCDTDPMDYIIEKLIPEIRDKLKLHAYTTVKDNEEQGGYFIIALFGRIFSVGSDFHVGEYDYDYFADGCGDEHALGAMYAVHAIETNERGTYDAYLLAQWGLEAAAKFSGWVCEPFEYMEV